MISRLLLVVFGINTLPLFVAENCTDYRDKLADAVALYTSCAIAHSHPIKFCEACVDSYIGVLDSYHNLSSVMEDKEPCLNKYVNLDRLQIIDTFYGNSVDLWDRAKCSECFKIDNGKLTNKFSDETIKFNETLNNYTKCIYRKDLNESTMCSACMGTYVMLNNYYISISNENEKIGICMDVVDLMNVTRTFWSNKCCKFRRKSETVFIVCTIVVAFITLVFYALTKVCAHQKVPIILKQNRFANSLSNVFN